MEGCRVRVVGLPMPLRMYRHGHPVPQHRREQWSAVSGMALARTSGSLALADSRCAHAGAAMDKLDEVGWVHGKAKGCVFRFRCAGSGGKDGAMKVTNGNFICINEKARA